MTPSHAHPPASDDPRLMRVWEWPHAPLRTPAAAVEEFGEELRALVERMWATMYHARGVGLAATQVAAPLRLFVMDCSPREEAPPRVCVNPVIVARGEEVLSTEGCLSFPGLTVEVPRAATVTLRARDERGEEFEVALSGLEAICAQHELDHLDGLGFVDRLGPLERRATLLEYLRGLEELRGALEGEGAPTGRLDEAMSLTRAALAEG